ncbi:Protein FAM207A [Plecturocebus cupreus]
MDQEESAARTRTAAGNEGMREEGIVEQLVAPSALEPEGPAQARPVAVTAAAPQSEPVPAHSQVMGVPLDTFCSPLCSLSSGAEAKTVLPKKEKMKLRRERWLQTEIPFRLWTIPTIPQQPPCTPVTYLSHPPQRPCCMSHLLRGKRGAAVPDSGIGEKLAAVTSGNPGTPPTEAQEKSSVAALHLVVSPAIKKRSSVMKGEKVTQACPPAGFQGQNGGDRGKESGSGAGHPARSLVGQGLLAWALLRLLLASKAILPSSEIEAIKLAEQKHREERRRRATAVVGDLRPLRDALPELLGLEAGSRRQAHRESSKLRPSELSRMSTAQRQQLLLCSSPISPRHAGRAMQVKPMVGAASALGCCGHEEPRAASPLAPEVSGVAPGLCIHSSVPAAPACLGMGGAEESGDFCLLICGLHSFSEEERARFQELLASPAYRASPLVAIGQTLARQMQLEGGGQL